MDSERQNSAEPYGPGDTIDIRGTVCPYAVVKIISCIEDMQSGEKLTFLVDDPLAIKSVPEETEEFADVSIAIMKMQRHWEIRITKKG